MYSLPGARLTTKSILEDLWHLCQMPYITVTMTTILYIIMLIAWKMLYANRLSDFVQSLVYYGDDGNRVDS